MGSVIDVHEDAQEFSAFYDTHVSEYLLAARKSRPVIGGAEADLHACLERHLSSLPGKDHRWGVKNPRSMLMLKFWHEQFPRMKFIHVLRHGLDMASAKNFAVLRLHGDSLLSEEEKGLSKSVRNILIWGRTNLAAQEYGRQKMGDAYMQLRLEDLCDEPKASVGRIFDFLKVSDRSGLDAAIAEVTLPRTLGRWNQRSRRELAAMIPPAKDALRALGYPEPVLPRRNISQMVRAVYSHIFPS
jgi:hypothetical protein